MTKIPFSDDMKFDPKTTLFITDLDGTLLTPQAELPEGAKEYIKFFYENGIKLTYATARTIRSAEHILSGIPFSAPIGLMNGVLMRDMVSGRYVESNIFPQYIAEKISEISGEPFVYTLSEDDQLLTSYRRLKNVYMEEFIKERADRYGKPFRKIENLGNLAAEGKRIIYFCYLDTKEELTPVYEAVSSLKDADGKTAVKCAFYEDHYREGLWYLEVFAATASKAFVCRKLREITGAETIVAFGDNDNDLPMFEESDYAFAVEDATERLKNAADGVIPGRLGVLEFIKNHIK